MSKRASAIHVCLLFFCMAIGGWASWGLTSLPTFTSWDTKAEMLRVGGPFGISWKTCTKKVTCQQCKLGSHKDFTEISRRTFRGVVYVSYKVNGLKQGTSGCANTAPFKICGGFLCADCQDTSTCECGKRNEAKDYWGDFTGMSGGNGTFPLPTQPSYVHKCVIHNTQKCPAVDCCR